MEDRPNVARFQWMIRFSPFIVSIAPALHSVQSYVPRQTITMAVALSSYRGDRKFAHFFAPCKYARATA